MATGKHNHTRCTRSDTPDKYAACLLKPMNTDDDKPSFRPSHVVDAALVGVLTFSVVILADVLPGLLSGNPVWLSTSEILYRVPTAAMGSLLAFAFMWLRARGVDALAVLQRILGGQ